MRGYKGLEEPGRSVTYVVRLQFVADLGYRECNKHLEKIQS